MMREPGLDRHEWQTEWEALEEDLHSAPLEALPELHDLIERMLRAHGFTLHEDPGDGAFESDLLRSFRVGHEVTLLVERGEDVDPGDVAEAIHAFTEIYEQLIDRPEN